MSDEIYSRLADALDRLPNGFPRTESNVELRILRKIYSPEEASKIDSFSVYGIPFTLTETCDRESFTFPNLTIL